MAVVGIVVRTAYVVGALYYVAFIAASFSLFQKLVILLIAAIVYEAAKAIVRVARPGRKRSPWSWL